MRLPGWEIGFQQMCQLYENWVFNAKYFKIHVLLLLFETRLLRGDRHHYKSEHRVRRLWEGICVKHRFLSLKRQLRASLLSNSRLSADTLFIFNIQVQIKSFQRQGRLSLLKQASGSYHLRFSSQGCQHRPSFRFIPAVWIGHFFSF